MHEDAAKRLAAVNAAIAHPKCLDSKCVAIFRAFTLDAAYAEHQENMTGSLEPGKWADFILVDRDLFAISPADIWRIKVDQTWLAGTRVY